IWPPQRTCDGPGGWKRSGWSLIGRSGGAGSPGLSRLPDQERVGAPLLAEGSSRTVTADEAGLVAERQQLLRDRLDQRGMIAARQIRAPDGASEKDVADMRES